MARSCCGWPAPGACTPRRAAMACLAQARGRRGHQRLGTLLHPRGWQAARGPRAHPPTVASAARASPGRCPPAAWGRPARACAACDRRRVITPVPACVRVAVKRSRLSLVPRGGLPVGTTDREPACRICSGPCRRGRLASRTRRPQSRSGAVPRTQHVGPHPASHWLSMARAARVSPARSAAAATPSATASRCRISARAESPGGPGPAASIASLSAAPAAAHTASAAAGGSPAASLPARCGARARAGQRAHSRTAAQHSRCAASAWPAAPRAALRSSAASALWVCSKRSASRFCQCGRDKQCRTKQHGFFAASLVSGPGSCCGYNQT